MDREGSNSILIVLDVPSGLEFGIDCITYDTGPKFKGLTLVPTGFHFVYHGTGMGARQGFFIKVANKDVIVKSWDSSQEEILPYHTLSEDSLANLHRSLALGELNSFLGPYPLQQHHTWIHITNFIIDSVLARADCVPGSLIYPGDDSDVLVLEKTPAQKLRHPIKEEAGSSVKPYFADTARVARFSDLKMVEMEIMESIPEGPQKASALTAMMMDKSDIIEHLIKFFYNGSSLDLLGEIQLSFVLFMMLYSYPALNQWKQLIYAVCSSERYLQNNPPFTAAFMRVLFGQLNFAPADFFENELSTQNFLRPAITALFSALSGAAVNPTLFEHKKRLRAFLQKKFNLYATEPFSSVDESTGMQVTYEEEDLYNIAEEDLPTFVSASELGSAGFGAQCAHTGTSAAAAATMSADADGMMDQMHIGDVKVPFSSVFQLTEKHPTSAAADSQGFNTRWAAIDSALLQSPASATALGSIGMDESSNNSRDDYETQGEDRLGRLGTGAFLGAAHGSNTNARRHDGNASIESKTREPDEGNFPTEVTPVASAQAQPQPAATSSWSPAEREAALFSWRYPLVFESMALTQGREDMVMTAARILEEGCPPVGVDGRHSTGSVEEIVAMRYSEAERFVEYEVSKF